MNGLGVPGVRNDDVVEWRVPLAEAGQPNSEDHFERRKVRDGGI